LQLDLLHAAALDHVPDIENDYDEHSAREERDEKGEERTVNRLRNKAVLGWAAPKLNVAEEGIRIAQSDCRNA
jgi:hypothetical protein